VVAVGTYAYISISASPPKFYFEYLLLLDVSNPGNPEYIGRFDGGSGIAVVGDYAYTSSKSCQYVGCSVSIITYDISNPATPVQVSVFSCSHWSRYGYVTIMDIAVTNGHAYVAASTQGLRIIDVSDPASPAEVDLYSTPSTVKAMAVTAQYAYTLGDEIFRVLGIDITNPLNPFGVRNYQTFDFSSNDIAVLDDYIYVADSLGIHILDTSNPTAPTEVGFFDTWGACADSNDKCAAESVVVVGSYAYVAAAESGLRVLNISDPGNPVEIGHYDTPGYAIDITVSGSYAYLAAGDNGLRIINISNPSAPTEIGFYKASWWEARAVAVADRYAYIAAGYAGLRIIDVLNPAVPAEVGALSILGPAQDVTVVDGYAYIAAGEAGLRVVDISDPAVPTEVGYFITPARTAQDVVVENGLIYVADWNGGLFILTSFGQPDIMIAGDFNGNGTTDVMWYEKQNQTASFFISEGAYFSLSPTLKFEGFGMPDAVAVGDFDGNGKHDIMWFETESQTADFFMSDGEYFSLSPTLRFEGFGRPDAIAVGDFDGNGVDDVLWYETWNQTTNFFMSDGLNFSLSPTLRLEGFGGVPDAIATGDFDGNGTTDVMWYEKQNQTASFFISDGAYFSLSPTLKFEGFGMPDAIATGDFDGNGKYDIIWYETWNQTAHFFMSGGTFFSLSPTLELVGIGP
jgi:hypothetical protein